MDGTRSAVTASLGGAIGRAIADLSAAWVTADQATRVSRMLE